MKKSIILLLVLFITIILTGCSNSNSNTAEVIVSISGGIPYNWEYTIGDESIIKYKSMEEKGADTMGGSNEEHYIFEGLKEGKTTLKFELKSITDNTIEETKNYEVVVDKNLKLTITEKK